MSDVRTIDEEQLRADCESFRAIFNGLNRLEEQLNEAQKTIHARDRGYFTPDEDGRVRQMLLAYRNYRLASYEIIFRYRDYDEIPDPILRVRGFMLAFASALTLYAKSLKLIQSYEHVPIVRKKLNEPEPKFELEAGFFDKVLRAYSSLGNYRALIQASLFWVHQRRAIQKLGAAESPEWHWLLDVIRQQRTIVRHRLASVLTCRLRYDWRLLLQTTIKPVKRTRYGLQSLIGGRFAGFRTTLHYRPAIDDKILGELKAKLEPGDILLVRAERKLTAALLPGFWAHAAFYIGGQKDLEPLSVASHPHVRKFWAQIPCDGGKFGHVIEAISPRALINPLEKTLYADHVVALRPNVSDTDLTAAITEAFAHVGKPYDFEFDFNVTSRIVCTELVYRCYHRRAKIEFPLVKRLGRYTLSGDDIMNLVINSLASSRRNEVGGKDRRDAETSVPFRVVALALQNKDGQANFVAPGNILETLQKIQRGWRPNKPVDVGETNLAPAYV